MDLKQNKKNGEMKSLLSLLAEAWLVIILCSIHSERLSLCVNPVGGSGGGFAGTEHGATR